MQFHSYYFSQEVTKKAVKAALKLCVMYVFVIWVTFKNMPLKCSGFPNCPGEPQHCLSHLTHSIQHRDFKN